MFEVKSAPEAFASLAAELSDARNNARMPMPVDFDGLGAMPGWLAATVGQAAWPLDTYGLTGGMVGPLQLEDIREALLVIPVDRRREREDWLRIVRALASAAAGSPEHTDALRELMHEWSSAPGAFRQTGAFASGYNRAANDAIFEDTIFDSAKRHREGRPVTTVATLFHDAGLSGFRQNAQDTASATASSGSNPMWSRFNLLDSAALAALPPVTWRLRGIFPAQGVCAIYGPSSSGKSFAALDLGAAIAEGRGWFGHKAKAAPVVYVALEGESGFKARVAAWEAKNARVLPENMRLVLQPFQINTPADVEELAVAVATLGEGAVVFIDTLNRAAPGADENSSQDMGGILAGAKRLQRLTDGLIVLVHHTGKDASKGLRGHSSLFAAMDGAIEVTRDGPRRRWRIAKSKDGQDSASHGFTLEVVHLGVDDGEPVTSCVVVPDPGAIKASQLKLPRGGNQLLAIQAVDALLNGATGRQGADPLMPHSIDLEAAVVAVAKVLTCEPSRRAERARDAINGLANRGIVRVFDRRLRRL